MPQYLNIISVARESLVAPSLTVTLGNDTSYLPLILLDTANFVRSADYKMDGSGTLTATFVADDSVGNRATVTRQLNIQRAAPASVAMITSVDARASLKISDHTFDHEMYLTCISEKPEIPLSQTDPVGDSYTFAPISKQLRKPASVILRYADIIEKDKISHLAIYRKSADGSWQYLPTSLDMQHHALHTVVDRLGTFQIFYHPSIQSEPFKAIPETYELSQNYPNPFNPTTTIKYGISEPGMVEIKILNVLGQEVRTLVDEYQESGYHEVLWDGHSVHGAPVSSGVYFYQLKSGSTVLHKKMSFLK